MLRPPEALSTHPLLILKYLPAALINCCITMPSQTQTPPPSRSALPSILANASIPNEAVAPWSQHARKSEEKIDSKSHIQMEQCRWKVSCAARSNIESFCPPSSHTTCGCAVLLKTTCVLENHLHLSSQTIPKNLTEWEGGSLLQKHLPPTNSGNREKLSDFHQRFNVILQFILAAST